MVTLEDEVDLTGEQTSDTSHTSITAGDTAPSRDGTYHVEVSKYLADNPVILKNSCSPYKGAGPN